MITRKPANGFVSPAPLNPNRFWSYKGPRSRELFGSTLEGPSKAQFSRLPRNAGESQLT